MKAHSIFLVALCSLGLTACGGSSGESTASNNTGNNGNGGTELDRCIEQAVLNGAKTGAEALAICLPGGSGSTGGSGSGNENNDNDTTPPLVKNQNVLVAAISFNPAEDILRLASTHNYYAFHKGLVVCDNSAVDPEEFHQGKIYKELYPTKWHGDKKLAGHYSVFVTEDDDNCLVQSVSGHITDSKYGFPDSFQLQSSSTIYRKGKTAYLDLISTFTMARLMGIDSYSIAEDIFEGVSKTRAEFNKNINNNHFDQHRNKLPSNDEYEAAEQALIEEIKSTEQYKEAANTIDGIIAGMSETEEYLDAYKNLADRAKLLAALYKMECKGSEWCNYNNHSNAIMMYSEGTDLKTIYSL